MDEKEPTLEELMAELDAGLTLNVGDSSVKPSQSVDDTDTTDFEAELGLIAKKEEEEAEAKAEALAAPADAPAPAATPATSAPKTDTPVTKTAAAPQKQQVSENEGGSSATSSWWSSVKASAEGLMSSDGIAIDTSAINVDYQRGKEASREVANRLSNLFAMASQEVLNTAGKNSHTPGI